ncbi:helix-turn-helix domain-containing protein [Geomonas sp. RF6]|uniref:AlkA N-terminal domain-containing protein n=1 Tax=Geomonas sp. RF6 TaxID=2897342 RepID=UPI001E4A3348|nr:AlkA N-terminal domain-containing protein [Geomonas sp. RF6]UFS70636.1 helix-turn-helix domain-containing protein [Geomonas sp. RF6]
MEIRTLPLDKTACYDAMRAHDSRFDGRFFCGVSSTGIYCRPICRVKLPQEKNCSFFPSAAAAEAAGYRPCLRCRPELAPGLAPADSFARIARSAARIIETECLADQKIVDLAEMLGITDRHLRRIFLSEYGVSPVQFLQTRRLLLAKSLLTDTSLPVTEVAMTAGFGSIRRFNDLFQKRYRLAPSRLRKETESGLRVADSLTFTLAYRPPYAWNELLSFLRDRAIPGVESVTAEAYRRTAAIRKGDTVHKGWISVSPAPRRDALTATLSMSLLPVLPQALARIRHLFDLDSDPAAVQEKLSSMAALSPHLPVAGIRVPGSFDAFEMATRAVLGQQVTVKAARTLATRLAASFGEKVETPFAELCCTFPLPERVCGLEPVADHLGPLGVIGARARSIQALAQGISSGSITLSPHADAAQEMAKLLKLPGFGPWTVQYVAMRALGWPDAFPDTDYGVKKALATLPEGKRRELPKTWSPWRSYATISLWNLLSTTKE